MDEKTLDENELDEKQVYHLAGKRVGDNHYPNVNCQLSSINVFANHIAHIYANSNYLVQIYMAGLLCQDKIYRIKYVHIFFCTMYNIYYLMHLLFIYHYSALTIE